MSVITNDKILFCIDDWFDRVSRLVVEEIAEDESWFIRQGYVRTNTPLDKTEKVRLYLEDETINRIRNTFFYFCNKEPVDDNNPEYIDFIKSLEKYEDIRHQIKGNPFLAFILLIYNEGIINYFPSLSDYYNTSPLEELETLPEQHKAELESIFESFRHSGIFSSNFLFKNNKKNILDELSTDMPLDIRSVLSIVKKLSSSKKMLKILEVCGQIKSTVNDRKMGRRKTDYAEGETKGFVYSDSLKNMSNRQMLKSRTSPVAFRADIAQGSIENKHQQGLAKTRGGPVIIVIDESASMFGEPEIWAKSMAIWLAREAISQKRKVAMVAFSDEARGPSIYSSKNFDFSSFLDDSIIKTCNGSGTSFYSALKVINDINEARKGWDVIFITDGHDNMSSQSIYENMLNKVKSHNTRIMGIAINTRVSSRLKQMSDDCLVVNTDRREDLMNKSDAVLQWLENSARMEV